MPQVPRIRLARPTSIRVLAVVTVTVFYASLLAISLHKAFDDSHNGGDTSVGTTGQRGAAAGSNDGGASDASGSSDAAGATAATGGASAVGGSASSGGVSSAGG